jgi:phage terminase large subunit-like protein
MMNLKTTNSYILEYYEEIKAGNIIVGQELLMMLKKLVDEVQCRNVLRNNIRIDFDDSEKRIKFIEKECKHYEAPHAGKPFILELFQKAFIESIFAIKIYDEELGRYVRKYQNVLFLVGRKNGKTPLIGAICLAEWFCGPAGLKILCASNDYDQADLMFQAINNMREESKTLEKVTRKNNKGIFFGNLKQQKKKGKFTKQNKGNIKKLSARANAKEGRNIGIGAVDEVFEMEDNSLVMPIRQALSTQDEPLYFELTTEGFTNGGYLDERLIEARQVLKGELENERWLIWLYTQDSEKEVWSNESSWFKSNPGLGKIKKWSFLRQMVQEARTNSSTKAFVLAKDFNVKQNNAQAWLQPDDIKNDLTYDMEELRGCISIGGVDLSETGDLTNARALILKPNSKTKYFITKYFIPSSKLEQMEGEEKAKYMKWVKDGYLIICDDTEVNQSDVVAYFVKLFKTYKIMTIRTGYDKWQAKAFKNEMTDYGFDIEKIEQGYDLSNAMTSLETDLKAKNVNFNQNPIDIMCLENVAARWNSKGTKRMPEKVQGDYTKKIDGAVTMLICYETLDRYRKDYMDLINKNRR